jgi:prepilin-type N-terminal cleavage/methylation domain-containing protein
MKKLQDNKKGFTIIEVLIVLAIGGLILLVVFLAVPALQRNSRNTQRKSDVSALAGAINEFNANNGGAIMTVGVVGPPPTGSFAAKANAKFGFYDPAQIFAASTGTPPPTVSATTTTASLTVLHADSAIIWIGYDCQNGAAAAPVAASKRSIAIQSAVEAGTGNGSMQCTQA